MPLTNAQKEIQRLTQAANDPERSPAVRLLAARKLLRDTNFSARSTRVAKRVAKLFFADESQSAEIRKKAASLLEFAVSKKESDEDREAPDAVVPAAPSASIAPLARGVQDTLIQYNAIKNRVQTPERLNIGWDVLPVPKKFIAYYEPADLPAFGLPAAPEFAWSPERALETVEWTDESGIYYVKYSPVKPVKDKGLYNLILNPRYVAAFKAWKSSPREPVDPRIKYPWENIFEYENHFSKTARCGCPVLMMWIPNQSFPKPGSSTAAAAA